MLRSFRVLAIVAALWMVSLRAAADQPLPKKASDLFVVTQVWTVHLTFSPDQWEAMEPAGGGGMFGAQRRGEGEPGQRGPGGFGGPGPATFLAPAFLRDADEDKNKLLSKTEF